MSKTLLRIPTELVALCATANGKIWLTASGLWIATISLAPQLAYLLGMVHLVLTVLLVVGRLTLARTALAQDDRYPTESGLEPFVSVHIATYEEPPELVCRTLASLANSDYANFEVIVLDNNTSDPALYEPVREYCEQLGERFRFFHFDGVEGAKAGALNIALEHTDPRTGCVLVLDADYQVKPEFISEGVAYFTDSRIALVQYPQAYRNGGLNCGLTLEYRHFFDLYMEAANAHNSVLATGTAAFIELGALQKIGGWPCAGLTEDADLGVRLHKAGYRGVYVPRRLARGIMPETTEDLIKQRRRWVLGNAQSLREVLGASRIDWRQKLVLIFQLTAWANPLLWAFVTTLCGVLAAAIWPDAFLTQVRPVVQMAVLSCLFYLAGTLAMFWAVTARVNVGLKSALKALAVHLSMATVGALSWLELFVDSDKTFQRTDKFASLSKAHNWPFLLAVGGITVAGAFAMNGFHWLAGSWLLLSFVPLSRGYLERELKALRLVRLSAEKRLAGQE